jgi:aspartyl-tRNA(Asn)/glutamyl-tRNA(Gln) amidotransferase subunit B
MTDVLPNAENLIELSQMVAKNELSSTGAKEIFAELLKNPNENPREIAARKNLLQNSNTDEIAQIVDAVLADPASEKVVNDIKNGNDKAIGFLVGQVMKASKGKANPGLAQKLIREKLQ